MPKTERDRSNKSRKHVPDKPEKNEGRYVTEEEREMLVEDVKRFKEKHEKTFRLLSEGI